MAVNTTGGGYTPSESKVVEVKSLEGLQLVLEEHPTLVGVLDSYFSFPGVVNTTRLSTGGVDEDEGIVTLGYALDLEFAQESGVGYFHIEVPIVVLREYSNSRS